MNIHLYTERFIIRDIESYDTDAMFDLDSNPQVHRFLGNNPISRLKEAEDIINNIKEQYQTYGIGRWAIANRDNNELLGWTGFKQEEKLRPEFSYVDLGYRLREKYWGQGIATETALACLNYGFSQLNFEEINACANIDHIASNKILQKIGLKYIEDFEFEGEQIHWYGLKKSEFKSLIPKK